ncbi:MAG: MFS transporter [Casimicrobiaceae bacterium]|nr:MFS transporter [Casimicrobiaceae bacterium]
MSDAVPRPRLAPNDLLRDPNYRRLFISVLVTHFGAQITMLALPLTAVTLLEASPTQMGLLLAFEIAPFVLVSLPGGVWLDRVRKLPVYIWGEAVLALALVTVPLAWWLGVLAMPWLYAVGFILGCVHVTAGSAAQIVLTQIVARERLVEAHSKNALATSGSEVAGPGVAGALIKAVGAPFAILLDALLIAAAVLVLRGIAVQEPKPDATGQRFWPQLKEGLTFVFRTRMLWTMALFVGLWQLMHHMAVVVQILMASRELGMGAQAIGLAYVGMGVGTIAASVYGRRLSERIGPGPTILWGMAVSGAGWLALAIAPVNAFGVFLFALMLVCLSGGAVLIFVNFLALRQAVTPTPLLGRMTSTMRWLILLGAGPGALLGGFIGEHLGLRYSLALAGAGALALAWIGAKNDIMRHTRRLPEPVVLNT